MITGKSVKYSKKCIVVSFHIIMMAAFFFSAGVGRSGAYIVIHSMVKRMHETGDVNIYDFVAQIRQQRNHLVQEEVGEISNTLNGTNLYL